MKWRPISELSDEQRDGRLWVFAWRDNGAEDIEEVVLKFKDNYWQYSTNEVEWRCEFGELVPISHNGFFLSEPLPDLPKPQKMEWRRFEDEIPEEFPVIILLENKDIFSKRILIIENACALEKLRFSGQLNFWTPIIPPEEI